MPKIALGKAVGVLPPLEHVINRIAKKNPTFTYRVGGTNKNKDGEHWVTEVCVLDGCDEVGRVNYGFYEAKENKNGEKPDAFGIKSENVKKERGERKTIITADPAAAVRHALKVFKKPSHYAIACDISERMRNFVSGQSYTWRYILRESFSVRETEVVCMLVENRLYGRPLEVPESFTISEKGGANYETYLAAQQVAAIFDTSNVSGFGIQYMDDGSYRVVDLAGLKRISINTVPQEQRESRSSEYYKHYVGFNELPRHLQDKVAVLKISEKQDPQYNFGIRFGNEDENFFYVFAEGYFDEHPSAKYAQVQG